VNLYQNSPSNTKSQSLNQFHYDNSSDYINNFKISKVLDTISLERGTLSNNLNLQEFEQDINPMDIALIEEKDNDKNSERSKNEFDFQEDLD